MRTPNVPALMVPVLGLLVLVFAIGAAPAAPPRQPNILLIVADDLGVGEVGCYGQTQIKTPRIDALAKDGIRCTQAYAGSCVCAPSRCALLTGQNTGHAAIRDNREIQPEGQEPLPADTVTLAKRLEAAGYETMLVGKWGLGPPDSAGAPWQQGFGRFYGYNCQRHAHDHTPEWLYRDGSRESLPPQAYAPDRFRDEALAFLRTPRAGPFFLAFMTTVPHAALEVPEDSLAEYAGRFEEIPYDGSKGYRKHATPRAAYAAMVTRLDRDIGMLLDAIESLGMADDTLVVVASDNGPTWAGGADNAFFRSTAGLRGHKGQLYEGGIRVPLIVRLPGRRGAGSVCETPLALWDLAPTLAAAASAQAMPAGDGIDLGPLWKDGVALAERPLYWEYASEGGWQAVRIGRWKAVRKGLAKHLDAPIELYDLDADPGEATDLASHHPELVAQAWKAMQTRSPAAVPAWDAPYAGSPANR